MAIDFPNSPTTNQLFTAAGVTWKWDGVKWVAQTPGGGTTRAGVQVFTASGTYVPSANLVSAVVECVGGGGGGGGTVVTAGAFTYMGGGGGSGGYSRKYLQAATIGASQTITIGAAGNGGAAGNNNGTSGGDTSLGSLCIGKGGSGGNGYSGSGASGIGGAGGIAGTGDVTAVGNAGGNGAFLNQSTTATTANGAPSALGGGVSSPITTAAATGNAGNNYGAGGSGGVSSSAAAAAGGNGSAGIVIVTEYIGIVPSGGAPGWVLLNVLTASSSATLADTTSISASYDEYEIEFFNIVPATAPAWFRMVVQSGGSFQTTSYVSSIFGNFAFTNTVSGNVAVETSISNIILSGSGSFFYAPQTTAGYGISGSIRIANPGSTTVLKQVHGKMIWLGNASANMNTGEVAGVWVNTAAITGFQFSFNTGNIASGKICIYGRKAS